MLIENIIFYAFFKIYNKNNYLYKNVKISYTLG